VAGSRPTQSVNVPPRSIQNRHMLTARHLER
jgi:hypothetical protein